MVNLSQIKIKKILHNIKFNLSFYSPFKYYSFLTSIIEPLVLHTALNYAIMVTN